MTQKVDRIQMGLAGLKEKRVQLVHLIHEHVPENTA